MITLTGHLICTDEQQTEAVRRHLPDHLRLTRAEPGCLAFDVTQTEDPLVWRVEEAFANRAAFDTHQRRTQASHWAQATAGITRDYSVSERPD